MWHDKDPSLLKGDVTSLATELRDENDRLHEENQQVREMVQLPVNFSHLQVCVVS